MRNALTIQVESRIGAIFISLLALFFVGFMFVAMKNFNSDVSSINATQTRVRFDQ